MFACDDASSSWEPGAFRRNSNESAPTGGILAARLGTAENGRDQARAID
jgi:hypothetical protein